MSRLIRAEARHFGAITDPTSSSLGTAVDVSLLVGRLIMFEEAILESHRLLEVPALVEVFGAHGLIDLMESGALQIVCDAAVVGSIGQTNLQVTDRRGGPLPLGSYRLAPVVAADREDYLHRVLQEVNKASISFKEQKWLRKELARRLRRYPEESASHAVAESNEMLRRRDPTFGDAIRRRARLELGADTGRVRVESDELPFGEEFVVPIATEHPVNFEPRETHRIVELAVLDVAGLNQRLDLMRTFDAVTGFKDDEAALFDFRLRSLVERVDPTAKEFALRRVISLSAERGLTELAPGIDVKKLLKIRDSTAVSDFRAWVTDAGMRSDDEITRELQSLRPAIAGAVRGNLGRLLRFFAVTGVGLIPDALVPAVVISAIDQFLVDRVVGERGPAAFLGNEYRSIYRAEERL